MRTGNSKQTGKKTEPVRRRRGEGRTSERHKKVMGIITRPPEEREPGEKRQRVRSEEPESHRNVKQVRYRRSSGDSVHERPPFGKSAGRTGHFDDDTAREARPRRSGRFFQNREEDRRGFPRRNDGRPGERKRFSTGDNPPGERRSFRKTSERPDRKDSFRTGYDRPFSNEPDRNKERSFRRTGDRPLERKPFNRDEGRGEPDRPPYARSRRTFGERPDSERRFRRKSETDQKNMLSRFSKRESENIEKQFKRRISGFENPSRESEKKTNLSDEIRLNRYISNAGVCSRREADKYIQAGVVTINGQVCNELGTKVKPGDEVRFDGRLLNPERKVYLLLNKPKDFVTTTDDPHAEATVMELVRDACSERIYPVGRLDKSTTGLLFFTNDGELSKKLSHPSSKIEKVYQVTLDKPLTKNHMNEIAEGIELEDGVVAADAISYVDPENKEEIGIEIHSGKNRVVRRIFEYLGYKIKKLDRVSYAGLTKKKLPRGKWRFLTPEEISFLKMK